jgi:hypothetical protein
MENFNPCIWTAWIQDCDEVVNYYYIPVLTLCGGYPFEVPTYMLVGASHSDFSEARDYFKKHECTPEEFSSSGYYLIDFDIEEEILTTLVGHTLNEFQ